MLKSIRLKNFKAYKDSGDIPLAPLTIVIGANNTGKSTIFQALLALKQTAMGNSKKLVTNGAYAELNGFFDIVHGKETTDTPRFDIAFGYDVFGGALGINDLLRNRVTDYFDVAFGLESGTKEIVARRSSFSSKGRQYLDADVEKNNVTSFLIEPAKLMQSGLQLSFQSFFPFLMTQSSSEIANALEFGVANNIPKPTQALSEVLSIGVHTQMNAEIYSTFFSNRLHRIGPLRRRVPWSASIGARGPDEYGLGGENLIAALGSEEPINGGKKTLLELVNHWIKDTKVLKRLHVDEERTGRMLLGDEAIGHKDINVAGMGEGISQLLPIVAGTLMRHAGDCLLIEQPEIHLHPALQAELGDLFIHAVQSERRQVLIETHSEHLLLRVRRRIAEGKIKPEEVAILFVEKHKNESTVRRLDVNERGHFSDWPKGFFDEAYQEAMALAHAASKKR